MNIHSDLEIVSEHITSILPKLILPPTKNIPFPRIRVGYVHYANSSFLWDGYFQCLRFIHDGKSECMKALVDLFLHCQDKETGWTAVGLFFHDDEEPGYTAYGHDTGAYPFLAQGALQVYIHDQDAGWLESHYLGIQKYFDFFDRRYGTRNGLYLHAFGADNALYKFWRPGTLASVQACAYIHMEFMAMVEISKALGKPEEAETFLKKAETLKKKVSDHFWFEEEGTYFNATVADREPFRELEWLVLTPLYAGIAEKEQAAALVERYLLNTDHFWSEFGIRTLSRSSDYYNNARLGNPPPDGNYEQLTGSNWQGPVWVLSNYQVFRGLINYGYFKEAEALAENTMKLLAATIRTEDTMYENYHAETGEGLWAKGFGSWNLIADKMYEELKCAGPE